MNRTILPTPAFLRYAKRLTKRNRKVESQINECLALLAADASHPKLNSHKLKGKLADRYACNVGYDLRLLFKIVDHEGSEAVLLLAIGTHDEVY